MPVELAAEGWMMGHAARRNPTTRDASAGKLMSRQSMMGAMDHALETHANALRILEARIAKQDERIVKLETLVVRGGIPLPHEAFVD